MGGHLHTAIQRNWGQDFLNWEWFLGGYLHTSWISKSIARFKLAKFCNEKSMARFKTRALVYEKIKDKICNFLLPCNKKLLISRYLHTRIQKKKGKICARNKEWLIRRYGYLHTAIQKKLRARFWDQEISGRYLHIVNTKINLLDFGWFINLRIENFSSRYLRLSFNFLTTKNLKLNESLTSLVEVPHDERIPVNGNLLSLLDKDAERINGVLGSDAAGLDTVCHHLPHVVVLLDEENLVLAERVVSLFKEEPWGRPVWHVMEDLPPSAARVEEEVLWGTAGDDHRWRLLVDPELSNEAVSLEGWGLDLLFLGPDVISVTLTVFILIVLYVKGLTGK